MGVSDEAIFERGPISNRLKTANIKSCANQSSASFSDVVKHYLDDDLELRNCGLHIDYDYLQNRFGEVQCDFNQPGYDLQESFYALQEVLLYKTDQEHSIMEIVSMLIDTFNQDSNWVCKAADLHRRRDSLRKLIVHQLCNLGYNAAICKSRWDAVRWLPGGAHEYIDVCGYDSIVPEGYDRVIIDIEFSEQFEIARPTRQYQVLFELLPSVFVGRTDRLEQVLTIMCEAAKLSLKKRHIHLPPWRTFEYMQAKWFSSYTRSSIDAYLLEDTDCSNMHNFCRSHATSYLHEKASLPREQMDAANSGQSHRQEQSSKEGDKDTHLSKIDDDPSKGHDCAYTKHHEMAVEDPEPLRDPEPPDKQARFPGASTDAIDSPTFSVQPDSADDKQRPVESGDLEEILSKLRLKNLHNTATIVYSELSS